MVIKFVIFVALAYFIGNVSPSIILGKIAGVDIKKEGSGNAGTTNALRVLGKKAAIITLLIDVMKGVIAVFLGMHFGNYMIGTVCALAVFCGHIWPCLYNFKGGKGVATAFGAIMAVNWCLGVLALGVVAVGLAASQRMSVGSILGAASFPVICWIFEPGFIWIGSVMALIIIVKHRANIVRLIKGEEPKMFGNKKKDEDNEE
ncbi:MAG: glycerol-3-phosphate 1-O-acyltransferase PlsY [Firmicutes bacterium]|nr:glycerol-3-phosphate 1-O-acyltransferase PlsY [Bacillota bacterium]